MNAVPSFAALTHSNIVPSNSSSLAASCKRGSHHDNEPGQKRFPAEILTERARRKGTGGAAEVIEGDVDTIGNGLLALSQGVDVAGKQWMSHEHAGAENEHGQAVRAHEAADASNTLGIPSQRVIFLSLKIFFATPTAFSTFGNPV